MPDCFYGAGFAVFLCLLSIQLEFVVDSHVCERLVMYRMMVSIRDVTVLRWQKIYMASMTLAHTHQQHVNVERDGMLRSIGFEEYKIKICLYVALICERLPGS